MNILDRILSKKRKSWEENMDISQRQEALKEIRLTTNLETTLNRIGQIVGPSYDVKIRRFRLGKVIPSAIVYIDGMIDSAAVTDILDSLMIESARMETDFSRDFLAMVLEELVVIDQVQEITNMTELFEGVVSGQTVLLFNGLECALLCETRGLETRAVSEPNAEVTIRGPRDGFIESLLVNTSLLRRRIRIPHLWIENMKLGELTQTNVALAYIKGLAQDSLIDELKRRLSKVEIDSVLESGYIEEFIEDTSYTFFPLVLRTERPDIVTGALLEGRTAILVDGTPHVLVVPAELPMFLQAPDDYYEKFPAGTIFRIIRFLAALISIFLPGVYVATINFHQELIPTTLLLRITAAREGVPFPVVAEILLLEGLFEILREAGIRLPAAIGPAISIVGALVLGEAAIQAGLVSPAVVIVIALTAIASFATPVYSLALALRFLRFVFIGLGAIFGLFGIQVGLLLLVVHLCSLRTLGVPYMAPLAPFILSDMSDNLLRLWWWADKQRPQLVGRREPLRQDLDSRHPAGGQRRRKR